MSNRLQEANELFEQLCSGHYKLPSSVPAAASLPKKNYNVDSSSVDSSERSTVQRFLESHYADGVQEDKEVEVGNSETEQENSDSGESSGGDRKAAADRAKKMVEELTPV
jgi:hypothetical protein